MGFEHDLLASGQVEPKDAGQHLHNVFHAVHVIVVQEDAVPG
jgi:hypothetical protein